MLFFIYLYFFHTPTKCQDEYCTDRIGKDADWLCAVDYISEKRHLISNTHYCSYKLLMYAAVTSIICNLLQETTYRCQL